MSASPTRRIVALDGLRAVAVVLVMLGHGSEAYLGDQAEAPWLAPLVNSSLGVRLFFVLSGFLITSLLLREQQQRGSIDWRAFLFRRCLRIWPALYAYLIAIAGLTLLGVIAVSPLQFLAAATFTWNYAGIWIRQGTADGGWFLGHLWTLALEQQFYLAWPALIILAGWRRAAVGAVAVPLLMPLVRLGWYAAFPDQRGFLGMLFHTAIDSILIGCAFALHQPRIRLWMAPRPWVFPLALLFVFLISPLLGSLLRPYRITVGYGLDGLCCGVLILAAEQEGAWSRWLSLKPLVVLGTISYGLYIWQQLFLTPLNTTITGHFPISVLAAFGCAAASFGGIERPFLRAKGMFQRAALGPPG
ncbi:acyltransferase [Cyanobium sp. Morenito 9A2]|uniref:acyltransferase family protein n=1 Tax=Cyanobium sp. Morenito 9A2 TaxID=2823718 RepID=UPI0020CDCD08|nr:acyltransferase [Cyanobium sp. Morenito 9A2]MCP9849789.1 acyltransferase [Cyanobium sp. Morenito 9A2]